MAQSVKKGKKVGHTGARTQDPGVISTMLYRLSYTTSFQFASYPAVPLYAL